MRSLTFWFAYTLAFLPVNPAVGLPAERGRETRSQVEQLTLRDAVEVALGQNPIVRSLRFGEELATAQLDSAKSRRIPSLSFYETFTHGNNPVYAFGTLLEQGRFKEQNFALDSLNNPASLSNFRSELELQIPVFNRRQTSSGINQARLGREHARSKRGWAEQEIRFKVLQAFWGVLVAESQEQVALESVDTAQAELDRIQALFDEGLVVASDLLAMKVQLAEFQQRQIQTKGAVNTAYATLNTLLNRPLDRRPFLVDRLLEKNFPLPSVSELVQTAFQSRPDYLAEQILVRIADRQIEAARDKFLPDLNLFASYGHSGQDLASGSADFAVGARLSFDLFDAGRGSQVRERIAAQGVARSQLEQSRNSIQLEIVEAVEACRAAFERLQVSRETTRHAAETLRIVRDRYAAGLATITEVLRAQTTQSRSQSQLLNSTFAYHVGYATVLWRSGRLTDLTAFVP